MHSQKNQFPGQAIWNELIVYSACVLARLRVISQIESNSQVFLYGGYVLDSIMIYIYFFILCCLCKVKSIFAAGVLLHQFVMLATRDQFSWLAVRNFTRELILCSAPTINGFAVRRCKLFPFA